MAIIAENLFKEYTRRDRSIYAVRDANISVQKGKITVIMGHSGSGKSTLLNILSGMITPERGSVLIDGTDIFKSNNSKRDELRALKVGMVPQAQSLISGLTVYENIHLQASFSGKDTVISQKDIEKLVEKLGLEELLGVQPNMLSGGEMKRVAIVRALAADSDYIFADEPTGELDRDNAKKVIDVFREKADEGKGVLIVTHDREIADKADVVYEMEKGELSVVSG